MRGTRCRGENGQQQLAGFGLAPAWSPARLYPSCAPRSHTPSGPSPEHDGPLHIFPTRYRRGHSLKAEPTRGMLPEPESGQQPSTALAWPISPGGLDELRVLSPTGALAQQVLALVLGATVLRGGAGSQRTSANIPGLPLQSGFQPCITFCSSHPLSGSKAGHRTIPTS